MKSILSSSHYLSEEQWAVSIVRKESEDHAFLILEGIDPRVSEDTPVIYGISLWVKEGTQHKKARIEIEESLQEARLAEIGKDCSSYTWAITPLQAQILYCFSYLEKERGDKDQINYVLVGSTYWGKGAAFFSKSSGLESVSKPIVESNFYNYKNSIVSRSMPDDVKANVLSVAENSKDSLLRDGHNCLSWAIAMLKTIHLDVGLIDSHSQRFTITKPDRVITGGQHNADTEKPRTGCSVQ